MPQRHPRQPISRMWGSTEWLPSTESWQKRAEVGAGSYGVAVCKFVLPDSESAAVGFCVTYILWTCGWTLNQVDLPNFCTTLPTSSFVVSQKKTRFQALVPRCCFTGILGGSSARAWSRRSIKARVKPMIKGKSWVMLGEYPRYVPIYNGCI